jgi:hypothetical protein
MRSRNATQSCPSDAELLKSTSGDLRPRRMARVQAHTRTCAHCTRRVREWNAAFEALRKDAEAPDLEAPTLSTFQSALFAEDQIRHQRTIVHRRRWSSLAAVAALVLVAAVWYTQTEVTLDAEGVIAHAIDYDHRQPEAARKVVRIRGASGPSVDDPAGARDRVGLAARLSNVEAESASEESALSRDLAKRLAPYGFDRDRAISPEPFARWRRAAGARRDRLEWIGGSLIKLSTTANGPVSQAEIVVHAETYAPISQRWLFADGLTVELSTLPDDRKKAEFFADAGADSMNEAPRASSQQSIEETELDLRLALYNLGAPAGGNLLLRRTRGGIRLEGTVSTQELASQIGAYGRDHANVDVHVRLNARSLSAKASVPAALRGWIDHTFTDDASQTSFVPVTWALENDVRLKASSLESLAQRYPTDVAANLAAPVQRKLDHLAELQYLNLIDAYEALETHLAPLVGTISRPTMPDKLPKGWRRCASSTVTQAGSLAPGLKSSFASDAHNYESLVGSARDVLRPILERSAFALACRQDR